MTRIALDHFSFEEDISFPKKWINSIRPIPSLTIRNDEWLEISIIRYIPSRLLHACTNLTMNIDSMVSLGSQPEPRVRISLRRLLKLPKNLKTLKLTLNQGWIENSKMIFNILKPYIRCVSTACEQLKIIIAKDYYHSTDRRLVSLLRHDLNNSIRGSKRLKKLKLEHHCWHRTSYI